MKIFWIWMNEIVLKFFSTCVSYCTYISSVQLRYKCFILVQENCEILKNEFYYKLCNNWDSRYAFPERETSKNSGILESEPLTPATYLLISKISPLTIKVLNVALIFTCTCTFIYTHLHNIKSNYVDWYGGCWFVYTYIQIVM